MTRYFFLIFIGYLGLNIVYKSYIYLSSDAVTGKVVGIEGYVHRYQHRARYSDKTTTSTEVSQSPVVSFIYKNTEWLASDDNWGYINLLKLNDNVTVLINPDEPEQVNINTVFQFWLTFYEMVTLLCLCIFGTVVLEVTFPSQDRAPKTWL